MKIKHKFAFFFLSFLAILLALILLPYALESDMLNPKGIIALKERDLMYIAILLMLIVVIPVFILTFFICIEYSAANKRANYRPDWDHSVAAEAMWWGFPLAIIAILSIVTWVSSHELDPFKPLDSTIKPLRIQVVALQWKWLFFYPEEGIATVNYIQVPEKTPLNFEITADAPMNSFWVPQLGGQIYAMPGMKTKLHLIADHVGNYRGSSANLSGRGFAGMVFTVKVTSQAEFDKWLGSVKESGTPLGSAEYTHLVKPSEYLPESSYVLKKGDLFDHIVMKYMMPKEQMKTE